MTRPPDVSVVVPAYDEEERLARPLRDTVGYLRSRGLVAEVIVVDDGSRDGTAALVRELEEEFREVHLIRLPVNRGKGFAVRTGVVNSRGSRVLFADADGATPISEIERLEARIDEGADLAIGSRALASEEVQVEARWYRRVIGRTFHLFVSSLTPGDFRDTQCGFKLMRGAVARELFAALRMDGFSFDVELLTLAIHRGYRVDEVPVNWHHVPGSRVNLVTDSAVMVRDLFRIRAGLIRGRYSVLEQHLDTDVPDDVPANEVPVVEP